MNKVIGILTTMLLLSFPAYSQDESLTDSQTKQKSKKIEIHFDQGGYALDFTFNNNRDQLDKLDHFIGEIKADTLTTISTIEISSYTSPEGGRSYNKKLSINRTNSIYDYMVNTISVPDSLIIKSHTGIDWDGLYNAIEASEMADKTEILHIIKNTPEETWRRVNPNDKWLSLVDSRNKRLMDLKNGNPYRWMFANIFPQLRRGSVVTIYFQVITPPIIEEEITIPAKEIIKSTTEEVCDIKDVAEEPAPEVAEAEDKLLLAIKTNILQLGVGVANIGAEIQLGDSFSLDIPFTYSPYTVNREWTLRALAVQPEFRYWLKEPFKGHFFGAHLHVGYFNVAMDNEDRYQNSASTPLWGGGLSYGYALPIYDRLNLEFNIGVGYASIKYNIFYNIDNGAQHEVNQQRDYWGITRAGVSLVYMFNLKK